MSDNWDKFNGVDWYIVQEWDGTRWINNGEGWFEDREKAFKFQTLIEYVEGAISRVVHMSYA